jgi:hypothetical protein
MKRITCCAALIVLLLVPSLQGAASYTYTFKNESGIPVRVTVELYDDPSRQNRLEPGTAWSFSAPSLLRHWKVDAHLHNEWQEVLFLTCDVLPGDQTFTIVVGQATDEKGRNTLYWTARNE